jgi:hypothetical protein
VGEYRQSAGRSDFGARKPGNLGEIRVLDENIRAIWSRLAFPIWIAELTTLGKNI